MSKTIEIIIIKNFHPELKKILTGYRIKFEKLELHPGQNFVISYNEN